MARESNKKPRDTRNKQQIAIDVLKAAQGVRMTRAELFWRVGATNEDSFQRKLDQLRGQGLVEEHSDGTYTYSGP